MATLLHPQDLHEPPTVGQARHLVDDVADLVVIVGRRPALRCALTHHVIVLDPALTGKGGGGAFRPSGPLWAIHSLGALVRHHDGGCKAFGVEGGEPEDSPHAEPEDSPRPDWYKPGLPAAQGRAGNCSSIVGIQFWTCALTVSA